MKQVREQLHHYGADDVTTSELLTFLLAGAGQKAEQLFPIVSKLVTTTGIRRLRNMSVMQLGQITGLDQIQAERLHALCVLTTRFAQYATHPHPHLATPLQALALLKPLMAHLDHEEFRV